MATYNKTGNLDDRIVRLRLHVEEAASCSPRTPKAFERLTEIIHSRTGTLLSPTTLKRLWNYLDEPVIPRRTTLDVLARFCGWRDFSDFEKGDAPGIESGNLGSSFIRCGENIHIGDRIRLLWVPSRVCDIEYIGGWSWKVISSEGTRLRPGDTFSCPLIIEGEPLYLDRLIHQGSNPEVYVCGRKNGIKFIRLE